MQFLKNPLATAAKVGRSVEKFHVDTFILVHAVLLSRDPVEDGSYLILAVTSLH